MPFVTDSLSCPCLHGGRLFCDLEQKAPTVSTHPQTLRKRTTALSMTVHPKDGTSVPVKNILGIQTERKPTHYCK